MRDSIFDPEDITVEDDAPSPSPVETEPNAHTLTLQFGRFLSESEWCSVLEQARLIPWVRGLEANAVTIPTPETQSTMKQKRVNGTLQERLLVLAQAYGRSTDTAVLLREAADALSVTEAAKAYDKLAAIIRAYDAYRDRGVLPAPDHYRQMVAAIEGARTLMKSWYSSSLGL